MDDQTEYQCMAMLGKIVVSWGFAEHVLEDLIAGMLGADISQVNALTANVATNYQIKSARSIARLRFDKQVFSRFDRLLDHFEDLVPFRNKIVHGFWSLRDEDDNYTVAAVKSSRAVKVQTEYVNLDYLQWLDLVVRRVLMLLIKFGEDHGLLTWGTSPVSPEISSPPIEHPFVSSMGE